MRSQKFGVEIDPTRGAYGGGQAVWGRGILAGSDPRKDGEAVALGGLNLYTSSSGVPCEVFM